MKNIFSKNILGWILALCGAPAFLAASAELPVDSTQTVQLSQTTRQYLLHVPASVRQDKPAPVLIALHGGASNAEGLARFTGLNQKADEAGFIVVYPEGSGRLARMRTWNGGNCCGYAQSQNIDDVAFIQALIADLGSKLVVDNKRIFATGMSNGAILAYRLACELPNQIAAIAAVAGTIGVETCNPGRAVPILHFHGTNDQFVPLEGGAGERSLTQTNFKSVAHTIQTWTQLNGCPDQPQLSKEPNRSSDGMQIKKANYGPCKEGAEVVLYLIQGGGHTWPGQPSRLKILGNTTSDISANNKMWDFFKAHPMP